MLTRIALEWSFRLLGEEHLLVPQDVSKHMNSKKKAFVDFDIVMIHSRAALMIRGVLFSFASLA